MQGLRIKGLPRPLPYAYFERWYLEDAAKLHKLDICCRHGSYATRTAFLSEAGLGGGVLHITTHGNVDLNDPECSRLLFAQMGDRPTFVHSLDILGVIGRCMTLCCSTHV